MNAPPPDARPGTRAIGSSNRSSSRAPPHSRRRAVGPHLSSIKIALMQRGHLNASDTVLTDADTGKTGFQVALAVGADTVKVKVTGEHGNTMDTDTVVVIRGAPGNTLATGKPSITGTAQVGMTLTAGPGDLADADGLSGVSYSYQWRRAGSDGMDIPGATSSTCTLTAADADKEIKVWADFTDEGGTAERRISEATLPVTDATVTNATRVDARSDLWELTLEPTGTGAVSILVPLRNRACTETGALCTADGRMLTIAPAQFVPGAQEQQAVTPLVASFVSVPAEHDGVTE